MNEFQINVDIKNNKLIAPVIELVQNDYNSTKLIFNFIGDNDYIKVLQLQFPDGSTWIKDIVGNEVVLSDEKDGQTVPVLVQNGKYIFDVAVYSNNAKLTTTNQESFFVRSELAVQDIELDDRLPILDGLIREVQNIDIDIDNSIVTITKKDGTQVSANVKGDKGDAGSVRFIIDSELPGEDIDDSAIYMIPAGATSEGNTYEEYIYVNGAWESLGSASVNVDMADYVKKTDYVTSAKAGIVRTLSHYGVVVINPATGLIGTLLATEDEITQRTNEYKPIVPSNLEYAVKSVVGGHVTLTQAEYDALETIDENTYYYIVEE